VVRSGTNCSLPSGFVTISETEEVEFGGGRGVEISTVAPKAAKGRADKRVTSSPKADRVKNLKTCR
jgi:hypothetical protein